jgi:acyl carrier protein
MRNTVVSSPPREIYARVASVVVRALNVEDANVTPVTTLHGDLGAESIELLDIIFRLEREFGIRIDDDELFPESMFPSDPEFVTDGKVTDSGLVRMRSQLPYADLSKFQDDRRLSAIPNLFTVGWIARFIAWKLDQGQEPRSVELRRETP